MDTSKVREYLLAYYENIQSERTIGEYLHRHILSCVSIALIALVAGLSSVIVSGYHIYLLMFYLLICFIVVSSASIILWIRSKLMISIPRPETVVKISITASTMVVIYFMAGFAFVIYAGRARGAIIRNLTNYELTRAIFFVVAIVAPLYALFSIMGLYHAYLINKYCPDLKDYNLKSDIKK